MAPRFDVVEGGAGLGGTVRYACAVGTEALSEDGSPVSWMHACEVEAKPGACTWRTVATAAPDGAAAHRSQGEAATVADAVAEAVRVIGQVPGSRRRHRPLAMSPAFVPVAGEPGAPRIWLCTFLMAADPADPDWTHLQHCTVREFLSGHAPYLCQLEALPRAELLAGLRAELDELAILERAGLGRRRWRTRTLAGAMESCLHAALEGIAPERLRSTKPTG